MLSKIHVRAATCPKFHEMTLGRRIRKSAHVPCTCSLRVMTVTARGFSWTSTSPSKPPLPLILQLRLHLLRRMRPRPMERPSRNPTAALVVLSRLLWLHRRRRAIRRFLLPCSGPGVKTWQRWSTTILHLRTEQTCCLRANVNELEEVFTDFRAKIHLCRQRTVATQKGALRQAENTVCGWMKRGDLLEN